MIIKHWTLFPTVVGECLREDLLNPVNALINSIPENKWGFQGSLSTNVLTEDLKKEFTQEVKMFLNDVLNYEQDIKLTTSWFTRRTPNSEENTHKHVNSWWSACYYLQDESAIKLQQNPQQIHVEPTKWTRLNGLSYNLVAKKGTLYIFASSTQHTALQHNIDLRYSVAMNFMPVGVVGNGDSTYEY
tara:strand:- start:588 stop:1148 length:561 start_codon:yes stop_codon:yes gene_type:complete